MKKTSAAQQLNKTKIRKRHWCLGSAVILAGSWITHTTTANISDQVNAQTSLGFAALPNSGSTLNRQLPDSVFLPSFQIASGPLSDSIVAEQSPSEHIFASVTEIEPSLDEQVYVIKRGDTLGTIFKRQQLDLSLPHTIAQHETGKRLVKLSVGGELYFGFDEQGQLKRIRYPLNSLKELNVNLEGNSVASADIHDLPFDVVEKTVSGEITYSLYQAALDAGLSIELVMEMVRIFGWDVDFVLDIRGGDQFHVIFEERQRDGEKISDGSILAAEFTTQNQTYRAIRYTDTEGNSSYYNPQGESMLGTFLRSPVEFSRISSRFGKRKHPILKTWRAHKGVDYAARRGTPIRATADGKVIHAGKKGGYGKTVVLRHAGRFSTLYAHMNGFAKGVRSGSRVKQGDIIGYVGSTGMATGPHLHYEFRLDGVHRNPLTYKTPKASSINESERPLFELLANQHLAQLDQISQAYQLAKSGQSADQLGSHGGD